MAFDFIFMLTRNDRTVVDAMVHLETALTAGLRHIGFKDIGLPVDELVRLNATIRSSGATSYLEVVSLDAASEQASARAAVSIGVDCLMGGTRADLVLPIIAGSQMRYFPFAGAVSGHPSVLGGDIGDIVASARHLASLEGVHGVDLLAYRSSNDVPALMAAVVAAIDKPVFVAGSIDGAERIARVRKAGAAGFTIGTAALDGVLAAASPALADQLAAVMAIVRDLPIDPA